jgi:hypothetical protein
VAYAAILAVYIGLIMTRPEIETAAGMSVMATSKKIIIYSGMLCLFVQVLGAYRYTLEDASKQEAHSLKEAAWV